MTHGQFNIIFKVIIVSVDVEVQVYGIGSFYTGPRVEPTEPGLHQTHVYHWRRLSSFQTFEC